jgi:hypothetical protein
MLAIFPWRGAAAPFLPYKAIWQSPYVETQGNCKVQGFALETEKMYRFLAAMPPKTYTFSLWRGKAAPHAAAKGDFAVALC